MAISSNLKRLGTWTTVTARDAAILLLLLVALFGARLIVPGVQITEYREVPIGESGPPQIERVYFRPYPGGVGYLGLAGLAALSLINRKLLPLAWMSILLLTGWSIMWLFSSGATILPVDGLLLVLLTLITITRQRG